MLVKINVKKFRSRYEKYIHYNHCRVVCQCHDLRRGREPSRIPIKRLKRLAQKSRKLRRFLWKRIRKNTPKSSNMHRYIRFKYRNKCTKGHFKLYVNHGVRFVQKVKKKIPCKQQIYYSCVPSRKLHQSSYKYVDKANKYYSLFMCNLPQSIYKTLNHRVNCDKYNL